jgi:hypothetical protein
MTPSRLADDLQLISPLDLASFDLSGGQFKNTAYFETHAGHAKRTQVTPDPYDPHTFVQRDNVDGEQHPHGVHPRRRTDQQSAAWIEMSLSEKAEQSGQGRIRYCYSSPDGYSLPSISDSYMVHSQHSQPALVMWGNDYLEDEGSHRAGYNEKQDGLRHCILLGQMKLTNSEGVRPKPHLRQSSYGETR